MYRMRTLFWSKQIIWILFSISSTTISLADLRVFVRDIRASHNIELYFNLFTLLAFFVFEMPFKYIMYCRMSRFHDFVERLQDSPLRTIASPASFRVGLKQIRSYYWRQLFIIIYFFIAFLLFWLFRLLVSVNVLPILRPPFWNLLLEFPVSLRCNANGMRNPLRNPSVLALRGFTSL